MSDFRLPEMSSVMLIETEFLRVLPRLGLSGVNSKLRHNLKSENFYAMHVGLVLSCLATKTCNYTSCNFTPPTSIHLRLATA